jgi:hypothetical protein
MKERNSLCSPMFSVIFSLLSISLFYFISLLFFRLLDCLLSFSPYHACLSLIFSLVAYLLSPLISSPSREGLYSLRRIYI